MRWGGCICYMDFLYYNLQLTFIPFLCSSYLHLLILCMAVVPLNGVLIGYGVENKGLCVRPDYY